MSNRGRSLLIFLALSLLASCRPVPPVVPPPPSIKVPPVAPTPVVPASPVPALTPVAWTEVEGWLSDNPAEAWDGFLKGCGIMRKRSQWQDVCTAADALGKAASPEDVRHFFEQNFVPFQVRNPDGSETGTITGYYVPNLNGSRTRTERYRWPLYAVPDDLLIIDLRSVYPDLANYRLRGRLEGRKVVPYYSREELDARPELLAGKELFWVEDPVELFFMQIQGSGRILLEDGTMVMVHYADQNGHPFRSVGKLLLEQGVMTRDQMSMQNIKTWAQQNPDQVAALLKENPSYVFFTVLPGNPERPFGALGVPLTPERSLAVDPKSIPLGTPVFLATTWPDKGEPLQRLMLAQDTGGAIRGAVRADFFWGMGNEAGARAGRMKHKGRMWVLLPAETAAERVATEQQGVP